MLKLSTSHPFRRYAVDKTSALHLFATRINRELVITDTYRLYDSIGEMLDVMYGYGEGSNMDGMYDIRKRIEHAICHGNVKISIGLRISEYEITLFNELCEFANNMISYIDVYINEEEERKVS